MGKEKAMMEIEETQLSLQVESDNEEEDDDDLVGPDEYDRIFNNGSLILIIVYRYVVEAITGHIIEEEVLIRCHILTFCRFTTDTLVRPERFYMR